jgi:hypothetical protein
MVQNQYQSNQYPQYQSQFQFPNYPQLQNQFQNQFGQNQNSQPKDIIPGVFNMPSETILFPSLEKMNIPLKEHNKYVINTVNYLLNNHPIGKLLEEIIIFKILHNSFFLV